MSKAQHCPRHVSIWAAAVLMLTACACTEGCAHEPKRDDPLAEVSHPSVAELEEWIWPKADERWQPLAEHQLVALERLVTMLVDAAEAGQISRRNRRRAATLAMIAGVELRSVELELDGHSVELWFVSEPSNDRRGRGIYLIRVGQLAPESGVELLLQAPHSRFDKRTGHIALRMLLEDRSGATRALFINSTHRFRQPDGSRDRRKPASKNLADAAHNPQHPFARTTARLLERHELSVVQLHGFSRGAAAGDPDIIVSTGTTRPHPASIATLAQLRSRLPEYSGGHFGVDTDRLGAQQNIQGQTARATGRCFVHIELSGELRVKLLNDSELRRRFASAVFGVAAEESHGGCR